MRTLRYGIFLTALGLAASSTWSYASEIGSLAGDVTSSFKSSQSQNTYVRPMATKLEIGLKVYNEQREFLGTTSAFTHRNGDITNVWFGDAVAAGDQVKIENGNVVFYTSASSE